MDQFFDTYDLQDDNYLEKYDDICYEGDDEIDS